MIKIIAFKASEGDSFLVSFGENEDINILIDLGLEDTYINEIKPYLMGLNSRGKAIDLLVITHVDKDHINGALSFIKENGEMHNIIKIKEVWHNTYKHLQFDKSKVLEISKDEKKVLSQIKNQNTDSTIKNGLSDTSIEEGIFFGSYLTQYKYNWNTSFGAHAACCESKSQILIDKLKINLLSPNQDKLKKLANKWLVELNKQKYGFQLSDEDIFNDAYEMYLRNILDDEIEVNNTSISNSFDIEKLISKEFADPSPINGSSISFILEYEGKKMLFLGDSHYDIIVENLSNLKGHGYSLNFDLVKISHHGSKYNTSLELTKLLTSKKYLFSTDGISKKPHLETLAKILEGDTFEKELIFNYELDDKLNLLNNQKLKTKYNYKVSCKNEIII